MSSSTAKIIKSRSPSGTRVDFAAGSGACHGSAGARENSREIRRTRTRETSEHGSRLRADPVGPEEVNDWLEALNTTTNRFDTLERLERSHAQLLNTVDVRLVETHNRLNEYSNKLEALNNTHVASHDNLCEACRNIVSRFENSETAAQALESKMDAINRQLQAVMSSPLAHRSRMVWKV